MADNFKIELESISKFNHEIVIAPDNSEDEFISIAKDADAIFGNGKMGKLIGKLATEKGHKIVAVSSSNNPANSLDLNAADVAIDFSTPTTAFENIRHAITSRVPVISHQYPPLWLGSAEQREVTKNL